MAQKDIDSIIKDDRLIDGAIREGVAKALAEHRRLGHHVVIWRNGKVVRTKVPASLFLKTPRRRAG